MRRTILLSAALSALAMPLVAQTQVGTGNSGALIGPLGVDSQGGAASAFAQTLMTPADAFFLQSFTVYLGSQLSGNLLFLQAALYQFDTDHVTGPALFESALFAGSGNSSGTDAFSFGDLSAAPLNVPLTPNVTYAIVLSSLNGNALTPDGSSVQAELGAVDYANGSFFFAFGSDLTAPGAFTSLDGQTDLAFNATFTQDRVSVTPEPASLMLMATGFAGVGGVIVRRRRKA